jgi:ribosomal protein L32E
MQKLLKNKTILLWREGKSYRGFHPTGYHQINWNNVRKLERMSLMDSTKCCATGTCPSGI